MAVQDGTGGVGNGVLQVIPFGQHRVNGGDGARAQVTGAFNEIGHHRKN